MHAPLAMLAAVFDRLGRFEPAAAVAGFALSPMTAARILSSPRRLPTFARCSATTAYQSLANNGAAMTTAAMTAYAYDQIDQARAELEQLP